MSITIPSESRPATGLQRVGGALYRLFVAPKMLTIGLPAPALNLFSITGEKVYLSRHRGWVVVVNFCTTWCKACQFQKSDWADIQKAHQKDLVMINIFMNEGAGAIAAFIPEELKKRSCSGKGNLLWDWTVYPLGHIPLVAVIDKNGIVRERWVYYHTKQFIETALDPYLKAL